MKGARLGLAALAVLVAAAPAHALAAKDAKLRATISRTKYGVPHIKAKTWQGLGFGYAYAFAEDNICTIGDSYVTVSAERSRYFGPDETWKFSGNGALNKNLDSDFFYARINESRIVEDLRSRPAPEGPAPQLRKLVRGYVAGYNAYLRDTGVARIPDPRCRGADWVRRITELDVYRRFHQLGSLASAGAAITGIGAAAPVVPGPKLDAAERAQADSVDALATGEAEDFFPLDSGSNAIGLGSEATASGKGMVLGNPHFPWDGAERLYQAQLTIPGKLDVTGGSLYGVPAVLIGQNRWLAWSHTVASAWRFTPFELTLVPGDPHSYLVDGQPKQMTAVELTVQAKTAAGTSDPDPRRAGHPGCVQRDQRHLGPEGGLPERPPRLELHRRDDLGQARLPGAPAQLRHLRRVREPNSAHAGDYTKAFSRKRWNKVPFCAADVRAQTIERQRVSAR